MILKLRERKKFPDFYDEIWRWCRCKVEQDIYQHEGDFMEKFVFCGKCHEVCQTN